MASPTRPAKNGFVAAARRVYNPIGFNKGYNLVLWFIWCSDDCGSHLGGGLDTQSAVGLLAILFVGSLFITLYNIWKLQLEQHRAWMLRAWFYAGVIISTRIIMILAAFIISAWGPVHMSMKCDKVASFFEDDMAGLLEKYQTCESSDNYVAVEASMFDGGEDQEAAALYVTFGVAIWIALALHAIGVELYLNLTPAEFERLRQISYQRQLKAGYKKPGSAGLTVDRLGDSASWAPAHETTQEGPEYRLMEDGRKKDLAPPSSETGVLRPQDPYYDMVELHQRDTHQDPGRV